IAFIPETVDVFALTNGRSVRRIGVDGTEHWAWEYPDKSAPIVYARLVTTPSTVYVIGFTKSLASNTLHVSSLSTSTGKLVATTDIPLSVAVGSSDVLVLSSDAGTIRSVGLVPNLTEKPTSVSASAYTRIVDINLQSKGHFVALTANGAGCILKLDVDKLKVIWEFPDSAKSGRLADSLYIGGVDRDGFPYIGRVFWSFNLGASHTVSAYPLLAHSRAHLFSESFSTRVRSSPRWGQGLVSGFTFNFDTETHGIISHVALHTAYVKEVDLLPYLAVTTSTGAIQLWQGDILQWTREEGLSRLQVAEMVELPEQKAMAAHAVDERDTFVERITRQLTDAKGLHLYMLNFIKRFVMELDLDLLTRDEFGFRQVIVTANDLGKIYGLDSISGAILWSRVLGLGWAAQIGGQIIPSKLFVVRTIADGGSPEAVLVAQRRANNGLVDTVLFHVNALTGEDALGKSPADMVLQGVDIISGPLLGLTNCPGIGFLQAYVYPDTSMNERTLANVLGKLNAQLTGHQFDNPEIGRPTAFATWASSLPAAEEILSIIPRPSVLGNRTTLYKYLNPHLFAVTTSSPNTCGVYVVDAAKGSIVYHVSIAARQGAGGCDLRATFVENWLVYVYWEEQHQLVGQTKGRRLVSVELYEGFKPDDKSRSSELSSHSNNTLAVTAIKQSYIFPHAITSIATTSTKYGISTKDIIGVSNRSPPVLNPRRTKDKPTSEEQEEWLIQYDPVLPDDAHRVLSHNYHVANIRHILTAPALLESTSLVFAYGLDLFGTRVAPSGPFDVLSETFNKVQLVFTICGLAAAIIATRPMVRRKRLRERWYQ
ncbi:hypothetical protein EI94DRAFT_1728071, partial [Lactarius quietus]